MTRVGLLDLKRRKFHGNFGFRIGGVKIKKFTTCDGEQHNSSDIFVFLIPLVPLFTTMTEDFHVDVISKLWNEVQFFYLWGITQKKRKKVRFTPDHTVPLYDDGSRARNQKNRILNPNLLDQQVYSDTLETTAFPAKIPDTMWL